MNWEIVIGLETHAQLKTQSKIFSGAPTAFGAEPNTQACTIDLALPGTLPVLNKAAVECAIRFGLAVNGTIAPRSIFARKNYFYPDLPKGYQISQYEIPVVQGGTIAITSPTRGELKVHLTRAHLEEDAGKSLHEDFEGQSGIDLNRAGTPLLEIVTEPDMRSSEEAVAYAKTLHALVRWIDICDGNMQEGSFRCDANVSVRRPGEPLGTRCEIKNLNSFRFLQEAIDYEVRRQIDLIEDGRKVVQETRLYDPERRETRSMRSKEDAMDYRYFPDPDLLPLEISSDWTEKVKASMPELPESRRAAFISLGLTPYQAALITANREIAQFSTATFTAAPVPYSDLANWITGPLSARLNEQNLDFSASRVSPAQLHGIAVRVADGTLSGKMAKAVIDAIWDGATDVDAVIAAQGLKQISDSSEIEKIVDQVLAGNAKSVQEYKSGKDKAFNALVGQVMKATKGKANPAQVNEVLKRKLS